MKKDALVHEHKKQNTESDSSDDDIDTTDSVSKHFKKHRIEVIESIVN